jgi:hypothetical protein
MSDGIEVLSQKVNSLADITARLTWVLSDADVGLVSQVKALAVIVGEMKESRDDHEKRIQEQEARQALEDKTKAEIRQPAIASFFSLVEKLLFLVISGALGWLLYASRK